MPTGRGTEFEGLRVAPPPPELRVRVLAAARSAATEPAHWIDRLWESRALRRAWSIALAFALALGLTVSTASERVVARLLERAGIAGDVPPLGGGLSDSLARFDSSREAHGR